MYSINADVLKGVGKKERTFIFKSYIPCLMRLLMIVLKNVSKNTPEY